MSDGGFLSLLEVRGAWTGDEFKERDRGQDRARRSSLFSCDSVNVGGGRIGVDGAGGVGEGKGKDRDDQGEGSTGRATTVADTQWKGRASNNTAAQRPVSVLLVTSPKAKIKLNTSEK